MPDRQIPTVLGYARRQPCGYVMAAGVQQRKLGWRCSLPAGGAAWCRSPMKSPPKACLTAGRDARLGGLRESFAAAMEKAPEMAAVAQAIVELAD